MKIVMLSKACIVGTYQRKLEEIAALPDVALTVLVPPFWKDERGVMALEVAHTAGYELEVIPLRFNGNFHISYYPSLKKRLKALQPELVHIDEEPYNYATYHALRAARAVGAKTLFFSWQNLTRNYPPPFAQLERYVLKHSDHAICGNQDSVKVWQEKGYTGPTTVIPQFGVDPALYPFNWPEPKANAFKIAFIGRLVAEKGVWLLLEALQQLPDYVSLDYVGSGPLDVQLKEKVAALGLHDRVNFIPWMPSAELPAYMHVPDVMVLPSISRANWVEQFGRVLVEAMACGLPVICSDCGEMPNVVGDAGLVFPENNVVALVAHLQTLIDRPGDRLGLATKGRQRVHDQFTQKAVAQKTVAVYQSVLGIA